MNVIVCVDDEFGMLFNGRRQSRDKCVISDIISTAKESGARLYALPFSQKLLAPYPEFEIRADIMSRAKAGEYVFVESEPLLSVVKKIDKLIIYKWNRLYPSDQKLDTPPDLYGFKLKESYEFAGNSHELITKEVYER